MLREHLGKDHPNVHFKVVTFGMPKVRKTSTHFRSYPILKAPCKQAGNGEFKKYIDATAPDNTRVYSDHDLMPYTPPEGLGYVHLGRFIHVLADRQNGVVIAVEWHHQCRGKYDRHLPLLGEFMRLF
jgi:hypothetical protein